MAKEICISSTPHETRLAILEDDQLAEIYYERENEYTLAGSIYKGRVTRVLPGMQSAFVDVGLERDAFLYVTDFLEEQEDSADFERLGEHPAGGGNERRESGQPQREGRPRQQQESIRQTPAAPQEAASGDEESPSGTRKWRGRRGRRRGGPRGQQPREVETHAIESPEAVTESIEFEPVPLPEHGAPGGVPSLHPSHSQAPVPGPAHISPRSHAPASAEPFLLPGESITKYGSSPLALEITPFEEADQAAPPSYKVNFVPSKPSTLIDDDALAWDGSSLLPGESISRYNKSGGEVGKQEPPAVPSQAASSPVSNQPQVPQVPPPPAPHEATEPANEAPTAEVAPHVVADPVPLVHEVNWPSEQPSEKPVEQAMYPAEEAETIEETAEFEPDEEASAFHRVDPVAPSELRVSTPVEEIPVVQPEGAFAEAQAPEDSGSLQLPELVEPPSAEGSYSVEYEEEEAPAAPQEHPATEQEEDDETDVVGQVHGFAPGAGVLEEEVIDEDEYDFAPLNAYSDEHDLEELEEETLNQQMGGAELGEMVRESHLNKRVSFGPEGSMASEDLIEAEQVEEEDAFTGEEFPEDEDEEHATADTTAPETQQPRREGRHEGRPGQRRGSRQTGRRNGGGGRRATAQMSDLPIISELLKQGQEILVQIAKEPIAKKGARITSHIALPGRFLVFMPTVNHVGVSRKISSDEERQRLKRILISEKGDSSGGFIVRTAAATASEEDLRADIRFLISLWNDIKQRSDAGKAPALIYHDLNLVERILRDQVSDNFSTIWVDSEDNYERIVRFLNRFQPSLVRRVKLYTKETPLFEHFGIQEEITKALKSKVWLKSGGSIVINQTEALVAIDINTGKYVGKTARLEDTILKTNLDAIPEIVRQIRLRDLGGIIVIDFIDMDDRRNRHKVMQALEDALKADRAPSKVLQFNDFGLVAITRKRVKQSLERTLSVQCEVCAGTGMVKSPTTVCNEIYTELRKMQKHFERNDILLRVHPEVVKTLKAGSARWLNELEEMVGKTIIVKSDPSLHPEQFDVQ